MLTDSVYMNVEKVLTHCFKLFVVCVPHFDVVGLYVIELQCLLPSNQLVVFQVGFQRISKDLDIRDTR